MSHVCKYCNKNFETGPKLGGHSVFCKKNPKRDQNRNSVSETSKGKIMSKEARIKISKSLSECHKNGKHPGWTHINANTKRSRPEEYFFKAISKDVFFNFTEKYSVSKYFLDFALHDYKCDIEIDGVQHFRDIKQIEHDKKRNLFLIENGWRVYRIPAKLILLNCELEVQKLKHWLLTKEKINNVSIEKY